MLLLLPLGHISNTQDIYQVLSHPKIQSDITKPQNSIHHNVTRPLTLVQVGDCWKYALEAIIKWLLLYFLVHDNRLLSML